MYLFNLAIEGICFKTVWCSSANQKRECACACTHAAKDSYRVVLAPTQLLVGAGLQPTEEENTQVHEEEAGEGDPIFFFFHQGAQNLVELVEQAASVTPADEYFLGSDYAPGRSWLWSEGRSLPLCQLAHAESAVTWRHLRGCANRVVTDEGLGWRNNERG